jgi:predicted nucleic acid-binding protein
LSCICWPTRSGDSVLSITRAREIKITQAQRFDLLIAAIAISNNLILVTRNVSDFKDIAANSNLMIENWFEE